VMNTDSYKEDIMKFKRAKIVSTAVVLTLILTITIAWCEDVLTPISIYDKENLLQISIEDVGKYHGDICPCLIAGFRATQLAISQLWKDEIPKREDFKIISAFPGQGSQDAFEFITRVKTRGDFKLELPEGTDIVNISKNNWVFIITRKSTGLPRKTSGLLRGEQIKIWLKEEVFPEGLKQYFDLRKKVKFEKTATLEEKEAFKSAVKKLKQRFVSWPADRLFDFKKERRR